MLIKFLRKEMTILPNSIITSIFYGKNTNWNFIVEVVNNWTISELFFIHKSKVTDISEWKNRNIFLNNKVSILYIGNQEMDNYRMS